jgi:hypothetical protein
LSVAAAVVAAAAAAAATAGCSNLPNATITRSDTVMCLELM